MDRWIGKVAVVTGASAGIGLATARALIREGMIVVGLARRMNVMEEVMKDLEGTGKFFPQYCDLSNEQDVFRVFDWIKKNLGTVHVLVNNAGIIKLNTSIFDVTAEEIRRSFDVNVIAMVHCTRQSVNMMKEGDHEGHIINISSLVGHPGNVPRDVKFNVHPAAKHAVTALSESLQKELVCSKIRVTNISPGLVSTEALDGNDPDSKLLRDSPTLRPEDIANSIIYVIGTPQRVQVTELTIRATGEKML